MAPEDLGVRADLRDELAGRRDDQGPGAPGGTRGPVLEKAGEDRDEERGGLARARLRLARDVAAGEGDRKGLLLDRGGEDEAGVGNAPADLVRQGVTREKGLRQVVFRAARGHEGVGY